MNKLTKSVARAIGKAYAKREWGQKWREVTPHLTAAEEDRMADRYANGAEDYWEDEAAAAIKAVADHIKRIK